MAVAAASMTTTAAFAVEADLSNQKSWKERQAVGARFEVKPGELPEPQASESVSNPPLIVPRGARKPEVPEGFEATLVAEGLDKPRQLLVLPNGDLLVSLQEAGHLMLLRDEDGDGRADWIERHAGGFQGPYGLAYREGEILVADQQGIWRMDYKPGSVRAGHGEAKPIGEVPEDKRGPQKPSDGQELLTGKGVFGIAEGHANRDIAIGKDGKLFVGVGSAGNIGVEPEPKATIQSFAASGGNQKTLASGLRNATGLAVHPGTGDIWTVVQERDGLGNGLVPDYLTKVEDGGFYGWPYSYIGQHPQPGFAERAPEKVQAAIVPDLLFEAHSAAMDLVFYTGDAFPEDYKGDAFVALKGSWNRDEPRGPKVVRVPFENGRPAGHYENFVSGFWVSGADRAEVWGRPADIAEAPGGGLYIIDDTGGTIWKITYGGKPARADAAPSR